MLELNKKEIKKVKQKLYHNRKLNKIEFVNLDDYYIKTEHWIIKVDEESFIKVFKQFCDYKAVNKKVKEYYDIFPDINSIEDLAIDITREDQIITFDYVEDRIKRSHNDFKAIKTILPDKKEKQERIIPTNVILDRQSNEELTKTNKERYGRLYVNPDNPEINTLIDKEFDFIAMLGRKGLENEIHIKKSDTGNFLVSDNVAVAPFRKVDNKQIINMLNTEPIQKLIKKENK